MCWKPGETVQDKIDKLNGLVTMELSGLLEGTSISNKPCSISTTHDFL